MPSKSKKQHNLMAAVANNPAFAKKVGISKSIGEEFMKADKSKKMNMGGMAYKEGGKLDMAQDKKMAKKAVGMHEKQLHEGKKSDLTKLKKGGMAKGCGYSKGGQLAKANGVAVRGKTKGKICQEINMAENKKPMKVIKEGDMSPETKALPDEVVKPPKGIGSSENDTPDIRKGIEQGLKVGGGKELAKKLGMKKGGMVKSSASKRADGIAVKGKTKGKIC